jgi:hypothetical protein
MGDISIKKGVSTEGGYLDRGGVSRQKDPISGQRGEPYLDMREEPFITILEGDPQLPIGCSS